MNAQTATADDEQTREFRRGRNRRIAWQGLAGCGAAVILAVPIMFGWFGSVYEVFKTPERVTALEASQKEIKESLARIEGALHIDKKKEP